MSQLEKQDHSTSISSSLDTPSKDDPVRELNLRSVCVLLGAFSAFFCSVGFMNAFGIFQEHYKTHQLSNKSESDISWIGSFTIFMTFIIAIPVGILYDRSGPQVLLAIGSAAALLATFMISLCKEYYQFFLTQGVLFGLASAFLITPSISTLTKYFQKNRALGIGIAIAGSSTGGVIWPIALAQLLNHTDIRFGWTLRIVGFIMLPLLVPSCFLIRLPARADGNAGEAKPGTDLSIIKKPAFILSCAGIGVAYLGLFTPFFFLSSYASSLGMSTSYSFYLVSIVNGASFVGRVLPGILADRYGCFNLMICATLFSGLVAFCWTAADTMAGVTVFGIAYGFVSGAIMSLQSACISFLATPQTMGTAVGLCMGSVAVMALVGTPIAGQLVGQYGYLELSMFSGAALVAGSMLIVCARLRLNRQILVVV